MTANVDIEVETFTDVIKVPSQAVVERLVEELPKESLRDPTLVDRNKKWTRVVYEYKDGKAVAQPVLVGPSDLTDTVILKGIDDGTKVVAGPFKVLISLKSDQNLTDKEEHPAGAAPVSEVRTTSATTSDEKPAEQQKEKPKATAKEEKPSETAGKGGASSGSQATAPAGGR